MQTDLQYKKIRIFQLNLNTLQNTVNRRNTMDTIMITGLSLLHQLQALCFLN